MPLRPAAGPDAPGNGDGMRSRLSLLLLLRLHSTRMHFKMPAQPAHAHSASCAASNPHCVARHLRQEATKFLQPNNSFVAWY